MTTRRVLYGHEERLLPWAETRCDVSRFRDDAKAIGHEIGGRIAAVAVFDTFSPGSCCLHIASNGSKNWLTRDYLLCVFSFPFEQMKFRRVTALIASKNTASIKLATGCGFEHEGVMREELEDDDLLVLGMLRRNCIIYRKLINFGVS